MEPTKDQIEIMRLQHVLEARKLELDRLNAENKKLRHAIYVYRLRTGEGPILDEILAGVTGSNGGYHVG